MSYKASLPTQIKATIIFPPISEKQHVKPRLLLPATLDKVLHFMFLKKVAEVSAEVEDILSTDSYIRYINKRVHTAFFSPSNQYITHKYTSTVDR